MATTGRSKSENEHHEHMTTTFTNATIATWNFSVVKNIQRSGITLNFNSAPRIPTKRHRSSLPSFSPVPPCNLRSLVAQSPGRPDAQQHQAGQPRSQDTTASSSRVSPTHSIHTGPVLGSGGAIRDYEIKRKSGALAMITVEQQQDKARDRHRRAHKFTEAQAPWPVANRFDPCRKGTIQSNEMRSQHRSPSDRNAEIWRRLSCQRLDRISRNIRLSSTKAIDEAPAPATGTGAI